MDDIFILVGVLTFLMEKNSPIYMNAVKYINNAFYVLTNNATIC